MSIADIRIDVVGPSVGESQLKMWNNRVIQTPQQQQSDGSASAQYMYMEHELYKAASKSNLAKFMSILESVRAKRCQHVSRDDVLHGVSPLGNTLLHMAAAYGNPNVPMEIATPSLILSRNCNRDTPLHLTSDARHVAVTRELVFKLRDGNGGCDLIIFNMDIAESLVISDPQAMFCLNNEEKSGFYLAAEAG